MKLRKQKLLFTLMVLWVISCSSSGTTKISSPVWQGIIPGETSGMNVENILDQPYEIIEYNKYHVWNYPNYLGYTGDPNSIAIDKECDCVLWMEIVSEPDLHLSTFLDQYGSPDIVIGTNYWLRSGTFFFASNGVAIVADVEMPPEEAYVHLIYYFAPTTLERAIEFSWSNNLSPEVPFRWKNNQYESSFE